MLKIYCTECGGPTTYTLSKPKFCSSCGKSFDKLFVNKVLNQKPIKIKSDIGTEIEDIEEDYENSDSDVNYVPDISKIDYEIIDTKSHAEKLGNIAGTSSGQLRQKENKQKIKKLTKADLKKFREEFAKEAGSLRPRTRGRKNG